MTATETATDTPVDPATGRPVAAEPDPGPGRPADPAARYIDRESSWLAFNRRVLELAALADTPLLERARFLAIFASNLDEFFMVRVAGLKRRLATGLAVTAASGLSPRDQLHRIGDEAHALVTEHARVFAEDVLPALVEHGISLARWRDLSEEEQSRLQDFFAERVYPVLTPLAVDPAHPFPYISGLSLNLAVVIREPDGGEEHFARVKVPPLLPRLVPVDGHRFVPLEDVIAANLADLFPGMDVQESFAFRVTRNEDLEVEEDDVENLLQALERELVRRRFGPPVRLEVEDDIDEHVLDLLVRELQVSEREVYRIAGPLDLTALNAVADLDLDELKYPKFVPATHPRLRDAEHAGQADIFSVLRHGDLLVHHPYDSFATSVQAFVERAAEDPAVLAIKLCLYRTSGDSPIVDALVDAAAAGKQVLVLVEIKARFDEQANIRWARALEEAGCHVVYGLVGLKTHAKLCLVVRQEGENLRRYAHIGTGNYNPKTARLYEDFGLLTADGKIGSDVTDLFNRLSGYSRRADYQRLLVAPDFLRKGILERIECSIAAAERGEPAVIRMKMNSLVDELVIDALYRASGAGVNVELLIRGICALRPGVPGLSENITARSILGRFLEHSRIFRFEAGERRETWIGSGDMMHRNLDRRIEAVVQVVDPDAERELVETLELGLSPEVAHWTLGADGCWSHSPGTDYQGELLRRKQGGRTDA